MYQAETEGAAVRRTVLISMAIAFAFTVTAVVSLLYNSYIGLVIVEAVEMLGFTAAAISMCWCDPCTKDLSSFILTTSLHNLPGLR